MPDSIPNVTTSPKLAAIGVAMLSGFIFKYLAKSIIKITAVPNVNKGIVKDKMIIKKFKSPKIYPTINLPH
jgi:hypothetical protein